MKFYLDFHQSTLPWRRTRKWRHIRISAPSAPLILPGPVAADYSSESLFYATDDETPWDPRRRPEVLQYREVQKQRRAKQKNLAVWNKTGQPDTPRARLRRHSTSVPGDSSSFAYHSEDLDEEDWDLDMTSEFGSSLAQLSDSRNSVWRKFSRVSSSSHSTASGGFSFTGMSPVYFGSVQDCGDVSTPPLELTLSPTQPKPKL